MSHEDDLDDLDELDIMFFWSEDGNLCLFLQGEEGTLLEYEFDKRETLALLDFLKKKYPDISKTAQVISTLADTNTKKKK